MNEKEAGKKVQEKVGALKQQLKEEVTAELKDTFKDSVLIEKVEEITEAVLSRLDEKFSSLGDSTTLNEELVNIRNQVNELKQVNEDLTMSMNEATGEIERLTTTLDEANNNHLTEVEELEEQNAKIDEQLNEANVKLRVHDLLDENVLLRPMSARLYECKTLKELDDAVAVFGTFKFEEEGKSVSRILKDIAEAKTKGAANIKSLVEGKQELTLEQKREKYLAGQIKESELSEEELKAIKEI